VVGRFPGECRRIPVTAGLAGAAIGARAAEWVYETGIIEPRRIEVSLVSQPPIVVPPVGSAEDDAPPVGAEATERRRGYVTVPLEDGARALVCLRRNKDGLRMRVRSSNHAGGECTLPGGAVTADAAAWHLSFTDAGALAFLRLTATMSGEQQTNLYGRAMPPEGLQWECDSLSDPREWRLDVDLPWATLRRAGLDTNRLSFSISGVRTFRLPAAGSSSVVRRRIPVGLRVPGGIRRREDRFVPLLFSAPLRKPRQYALTLHLRRLPGQAAPFDVFIQGRAAGPAAVSARPPGRGEHILVQRFDRVSAIDRISVEFRVRSGPGTVGRLPMLCGFEAEAIKFPVETAPRRR
jgi:hypothetical protein